MYRINLLLLFLNRGFSGSSETQMKLAVLYQDITDCTDFRNYQNGETMVAEIDASLKFSLKMLSKAPEICKPLSIAILLQLLLTIFAANFFCDFS
jgi:hypothetical protein